MTSAPFQIFAEGVELARGNGEKAWTSSSRGALTPSLNEEVDIYNWGSGELPALSGAMIARKAQ